MIQKSSLWRVAATVILPSLAALGGCSETAQDEGGGGGLGFRDAASFGGDLSAPPPARNLAPDDLDRIGPDEIMTKDRAVEWAKAKFSLAILEVSSNAGGYRGMGRDALGRAYDVKILLEPGGIRVECTDERGGQRTTSMGTYAIAQKAENEKAQQNIPADQTKWDADFDKRLTDTADGDERESEGEGADLESEPTEDDVVAADDEADSPAADPHDVEIPDKPLSGKVFGKRFRPNMVRITDNIVQITNSDMGASGVVVQIVFKLEPGVSLFDRPIRLRTDKDKLSPTAHVALFLLGKEASNVEMKQFLDDCVVVLEFDKPKKGKRRGKLFLATPDAQKSTVSGAFTVLE